jgi:urea transport system substrate-binding protein
MRFWFITVFIMVFIGGSVALLRLQKNETIRIGLLYSQTGTMAGEERVIADMVRLAVEEINEQGGLLHKKIEIVEYDGKSEPEAFAKGASELIAQDAAVMFGCWTSASRKAVKPVVEAKGGLLFYPLQYEGGEESKNIVYLGMSANQQINPTIAYLKRRYGNRLYVVGSDYVYPRMAGLYIDTMAGFTGIEVVGLSYLPLGSTGFGEVVSDIRRLKPDAILNTINGSSNIPFFKALRDAGIGAEEIPVFSLSLDQSSIEAIASVIGMEPLMGHYATWSYFDTIDDPANARFKEKVYRRFGTQYRVTDAGYKSYLAVQFWKSAVLNTQTTDTEEIRAAVVRESIDSAEGIVYLDPRNNHLSQRVRIAAITPKGFELRWSSEHPVLPNPFPSIKPREFWEQSQRELYRSWNNRWESPQERP